MKKVRLFAIAASFGMLAATVNAAEVVKYNTTWTNVPEGEVIRAEFGGNIVAPALGAEVTKFVQSTTGDAKKVCVKPDGTTALDSNLDGVADQVFYNLGTPGFWYFTDAKFTPTPTTMKYYTGMTKNAAGGRILYPGQAAMNGIVSGINHKFVSFDDAAGIDAILANALATGGASVSEDEDGFLTYKLIDSGTTGEEGYDSYITKQYHAAVYRDPADGIYKVDGTKLNYYYKDAQDVVIDAKDYGTKVARANEAAKEEVLRYITGLTVEDAEIKTLKYSYFNTDHVAIKDTTVTVNGKLVVTAYGGAHPVLNNVTFDNPATPDVDEVAVNHGNKYRVLEKEETAALSGLVGGGKKIANAATLSDLSFNVYTIGKNGVLVRNVITANMAAINAALPSGTNAQKVAYFLEGSGIAAIKADGTGGTDLSTRVLISNARITGSTVETLDELDLDIINFGIERGNVRAYDKMWDAESETFVNVLREPTEGAITTKFNDVDDVNNLINRFGGYYTVDTPANKSDKFVVDYTLGAYPFNNRFGGLLSKSKMTLTYNPKVVPVNHVGVDRDAKYVVNVQDFSTRYDDIFLPSFDSEEEAVQYMNAMAGLQIANESYIADLEAYRVAAAIVNKAKGDITYKDNPRWVTLADGTRQYLQAGEFLAALDHDRTFLDGTKKAYVPANILDHTTSTQCVYTDAGTKLEAGDFTVTNNLAEINAQSYGVKELKYTAKVGETVVGEKTIKVVVAPKYERTWVGGRVSTLKAFHLNGAAYALYQYNYTTKTVKVTFYELDGVTVSSTAEFPL